MLESILKYSEGLGASQEIISWLNTSGKKALLKNKTNNEELEHIVDYFISSAAPKRLQKMSIEDAKRKAKEWSESNQKKGKNLIDTKDDIEIFLSFEDGTRIVKLLSTSAYKREGFLMSHCLGGYSIKSEVDIYSYRDKKNMPHATFEVQKNSNEIVQIKGKGNGPIHPKYIFPVLEFLKKLGLDIRPNDMKNLGYYHIDKSHLEFLKQSDAQKQIHEINGEFYAV